MTLDTIPTDLRDLLASRELYTKVRWEGYEAFLSGQFDGEPTTDLAVADLAASQRRGGDDHAIMFDIDHPAIVGGGILRVNAPDRPTFVWSTGPYQSWLIPSTQPDHHHLYVDVGLPWRNVLGILEDFAEAGVVESGYVLASRNRGKTSLRLPWVKKILPPPGKSVTVEEAFPF